MKPVIVIFLLSVAAFAQTSAITATITDPDGQTWNNGTYILTFVPAPNTQQPSMWQGSASFTKQYSGSLSSSGVLTVSVADNAYVSPPGSQWQFTLCSQTSAPCQNVTMRVSGASPNLSTQLSNQIIAPRFGAGQFSYGYADLEVLTPSLPGAVYWNVTSSVQRVWNGSAWQNNAGGTGNPCSSTPGALQYNNSGAFGCATPFTFSGSAITGSSAGILNLSSLTLANLELPATFFEVNSSGLSSVAGINFITSTTNTVGLTATPTNSSANQLKFEISGASYTGNAATATNLSGCSGSAAGDICYWNGSAWTRLAGNASGTNWLQETSSGVPSWTSPSGSGNMSDGSGSSTAGYFPATTTTAHTYSVDTNIDDGHTTASTITFQEPLQIVGSTHGITIPAGTASSGVANKVVYGVDSTNGYAEVNENNTGLSRVCTAANGICSGGSGLNGTVTYTSSQTASTSDNGKLVVMNCSSACTYTLPTSQPSTTWAAGVTSQGSTLATIALSGGDTFNGSTSVPALNSYRILWVFANTATSTDYRGDAPLIAGSNMTFTPASNGLTVAANGSTVTVASGTSAMGTSAISSGTCATTVTTSASGVATTDTIQYTPSTNPQSSTGYAASASGSLYIWAYPTSGNVNFEVCNNTSGSITPGALTLNWRVTR